MGTRDLLRIAELLELFAGPMEGDNDTEADLIDELEGYAAQLREEASE